MSRARLSVVRRLGLACGALAVVLAVLALASPGRASYDKDERRQTMRSVVFLLALKINDDKSLTPIASGSGTILSADGAILTNHHVIWDADAKKPFPLIAVGLTRSFDAEPELVCVADPSKAIARPELDLALIKCDMDLQGRPISPSGWTPIALGDSSDLVPGDDVFVLGYPGVGGSTIHVTAGKISGFQGETGGAGRAWIKTDAAINHGNSGGTAVDEDGKLVGVPSAFRLAREKTGETSGTVGLIRPIEHGRELIAAAAGGWTPGAVVAPPTAPTPTAPPTGDARAVSVVGRVIDAESGEAIAGAFVAVFKPGVAIAAVSRATLGKSILARGLSGHDGSFTLEAPVPRGQRYAVMVFARGHELLAADAILSTLGDVPDVYEPWDVLRLTPSP